MKKIMLICIVSSIFTSVFAQEELLIELKPSKPSVIYLDKDEKNNLNKTDASVTNDLDSKKNTKAKANSINVYIKWLNPLKYKLNWKDTTLTDPRDKAISDFVNLLVAQFGTQVQGLNKTSGEGSKLIEPTKLGTRNFSNVSLMNWYLHIIENRAIIEADLIDVEKINKIANSMEKLDEYNSKDTPAEASSIYVTLFNMSDLKQYNILFPEQRKLVGKIEGKDEGFIKIEELLKAISDELKSFDIKSSPLLGSFSKSVIVNYLESVKANLKSKKTIIQKLNKVMDLVESSTANQSLLYPEYVKIRSAEFDNGKILKTNLTITEYDFDKETAEFSKKSDVVTQKFVFKQYDRFDIFVSTGLFYGTTVLKGFGVKNLGNNKFSITEDDIEKNQAVSAVFLNYALKISPYFSPLIQLGVDPTKRRPFLLFGIGFSIPTARIALSGGPIWTWNQTLDKLKLEQEITSTTELEKDIKYSFDASPKGWYIGVQYKF